MGNWECVCCSNNLAIFSWFVVDIIILKICHWWNLLVWVVWYPGLSTYIAGTLVQWHWSIFPATVGFWNCSVLFGLCAATALIVVCETVEYYLGSVLPLPWFWFLTIFLKSLDKDPRGSSIDIVTRLQAGWCGSGCLFPAFSPQHTDQPWSQCSLLLIGYQQLFIWRWNELGELLTTHWHLVENTWCYTSTLSLCLHVISLN
jgi:hypothetical protein